MTDPYADYNAGVDAATRAYASDRAVADGLCAVCGHRIEQVRDRHRRCQSCRKNNRSERG